MTTGKSPIENEMNCPLGSETCHRITSFPAKPCFPVHSRQAVSCAHRTVAAVTFFHSCEFIEADFGCGFTVRRAIMRALLHRYEKRHYATLHDHSNARLKEPPPSHTACGFAGTLTLLHDFRKLRGSHAQPPLSGLRGFEL